MREYICHQCVSEAGLREWIIQNGFKDNCDYCDLNSKVCSTLEMIEFIIERISHEYEDPAHSMGYIGSEGGYIGTMKDCL